MNSFKLMLSFFTRLPVKNVEFNEEEFKKGIKYTPLVGGVIGTILVLIAYLTETILSKDVEAFFILIVYIFVTGGLHLDGLSDTCDGIFSNRPQEKMLEIMKDSRVGSFGVVALILLLIGDFIFLSKNSLWIIFIFPIIGRTGTILACSVSKYARTSGMGKIFIENGGEKPCIYVSVFINLLIGIISVVLGQWTIILAMLLTYVISYFIIRNIKEKLNGITGDVLGFNLEICQILFLIFTYIGGTLF